MNDLASFGAPTARSQAAPPVSVPAGPSGTGTTAASLQSPRALMTTSPAAWSTIYVPIQRRTDTPAKLRVATASLCGCFGCHMSLLDIDERILQLVELVEFDRSPLTDIKTVGDCDLGLIEGGVANTENVEVLREFRHRCKVLVAVGACAVNGGIPAMRNQFTLKECLEESYVSGVGVHNPGIPRDPEIPLLLNKVHPLHEVVKVDHSLPGCPPSADAIWTFLTEVLSGGAIEFPNNQIQYD